MAARKKWGEMVEEECIKKTRAKNYPVTEEMVRYLMYVIREKAHQEKMVKGKRFRYDAFVKNFLAYAAEYSSPEGLKVLEAEKRVERLEKRRETQRKIKEK